MRLPDYLTGTADITFSSAENGELRVNLGDAASGKGFDSDVPVYGVDGFLSRPNDADEDGAVTAVYFHDGHQRRVVGTRDNRFAAQAGTMDPGDRMIVTSGPPRFYMKQARQRVGLYTESVATPPVGGKGMTLDLDGEGNIVQLRYGGCLLVADGKKWTITAANGTGNASIVIDPATGITITGGAVYLDAPFVTLGLNTGGGRPGIPGVDTVLYGAMGQSGVASGNVFVAKF